jgi:hypothetical protein
MQIGSQLLPGEEVGILHGKPHGMEEEQKDRIGILRTWKMRKMVLMIKLQLWQPLCE